MPSNAHPHAEERSESASRSTHIIGAVFLPRSEAVTGSSARGLIVRCKLMGKDQDLIRPPTNRVGGKNRRGLWNLRPDCHDAWRRAYIMTTGAAALFTSAPRPILPNASWEHRNNVADSFTKKYSLHRLAYAEMRDDIVTAKQRERNIKHWSRAWQGRLILKEKTQLVRS